MGLLNALITSATRFKDDLAPIGYGERAVTWIINIDSSGKQSAEVKPKQIPKQLIFAPKTPTDRTSGSISPSLLVDKVSYALGITNEKKRGDAEEIAQREHKSFIDLVNKASSAIDDEALKHISGWLSTPENIKNTRDLITAKPNDLVLFEVGELPRPTDNPAVQSFWAKHMEQRLCTKEKRPCVICGKEGPVLRIIPFKIGLPFCDVQMASFNEDAFCSGGSTTRSSYNGAICFSCASVAIQVLEYLLKQDKEKKSGRHIVSIATDEKKDSLLNQYAIFWTKDPIIINDKSSTKYDIDEIPRLLLEDIDKISGIAPPAYESQLRGMLEAPWQGGHNLAVSAANKFYLAILSPNKSRLVVREWLEQGISSYRDNIKHYVDALKIIHPTGRGIWFPPLPAILTALQSPTSSKRESDEKKRLPQVEPDLVRKLIRCMFSGTHPPEALLTRAVRCFRIPDPPADNDQQRERQMLRRMALASAMKLFLTYKKGEEVQAMEELHTDHDVSSGYKQQSPYLCGCLLAILEAIQARPGNKVNTTLVDRFYGAASTAPATVFANLINMATKAHLPKLRRENMETFTLRDGKKVNINNLLTECCSAINNAGGFPPPLSPEQQAQFALGFYHQRAEFSRQPLQSSGTNSTGGRQ